MPVVRSNRSRACCSPLHVGIFIALVRRTAGRLFSLGSFVKLSLNDERHHDGMKALTAAAIAAVILYLTDQNLSGGLHSRVVINLIRQTFGV
jgi:hypothetical protein